MPNLVLTGSTVSRYETVEVMPHEYEHDNECPYRYDIVGLVKDGTACEYAYTETWDYAQRLAEQAATETLTLSH